MGAEHDRILAKELALRFSDPDDPGLYERRKRLRALFRRVPVADGALHARLGERRPAMPSRSRFTGVSRRRRVVNC